MSATPDSSGPATGSAGARRWVPIAAMLLVSCNGGVSTHEVEVAAAERARQELGLAADAPLDVDVWTADEYDGDLLICGNVTGVRPGGREISRQRFAARMEPFRWVMFEDVRTPGQPLEPDSWPEWNRICDRRAQS